MAACYVVMTAWSSLWTILSIATTLAILYSLSSPQWLISPENLINSRSNNATTSAYAAYPHSIGLYQRCISFKQNHGIESTESSIAVFSETSQLSCSTFLHNFGQSNHLFPTAWQASLFLIGMGCLSLIFTMITSIASLCRRDICGKSLFTVSGLIQVIAGILLILSVAVAYPLGWQSAKVKFYCGHKADIFDKGLCQLGWAYIVTIACSIACLPLGMISIKADQATSKREIEELVYKGQTLICV